MRALAEAEIARLEADSKETFASGVVKPLAYSGNVLQRLQAARLVEVDDAAGEVVLTPLGVRQVEEKVLPR